MKIKRSTPQEEFKTLLDQNQKELKSQFKNAVEESSNLTAQEVKSIQKIAELSKQLNQPSTDTFVKSQTKEITKISAQSLSKILGLIKKT